MRRDAWRLVTANGEVQTRSQATDFFFSSQSCFLKMHWHFSHWEHSAKITGRTSFGNSAFASRSKAKAKPQRRTSARSSTETIPIGERFWTDIEPQKYSLSDHSVSKKLINLLRHGSLPRGDDGAIEFWRIKDYLQNHFAHSRHCSDEKWKSIMARG